jgi:hypothetical protein
MDDDPHGWNEAARRAGPDVCAVATCGKPRDKLIWCEHHGRSFLILKDAPEQLTVEQAFELAAEQAQ